ncbi:MAG TPA: hypothetical protein VHJ79_22635 [Mycobacterium sp.]|nr:hypothetical protein [Mycobacterium sp.]
MNRQTIATLAVVVVALLLAGGVVLAKSITCSGGTCNGTKKADQITGSVVADTINGRGGNDEIDGGNGSDTIVDNGTVPDVDIITGGKGDDLIDVREGDPTDTPDKVDCGPGTDIVFFDATDTRLNCEFFNPS